MYSEKERLKSGLERREIPDMGLLSFENGIHKTKTAREK